jgi:malonyl CoA-acyl carrier protein transacylase
MSAALPRYAVLFPGQGSQHAAMLPWLEAEPAAGRTLAAMAARLGPDWRARLASDEAWRQRNAIAQVLVTGSSLAAWAVLAPKLPGPPTIVAGYSVGELAAAACAGAFGPAAIGARPDGSHTPSSGIASQASTGLPQVVQSPAGGAPGGARPLGRPVGWEGAATTSPRTPSPPLAPPVQTPAEALDARMARALDLAAARAAAMDAAVAGRPTGLLSVAGRPESFLTEACRRFALEVAIRLADDHAILAGEDATLHAAERALGDEGATCKRLSVPIASHSSWMAPAVAPFTAALAAEPFPARLPCAIALDATGAVTRQGEALRHGLATQLDHPVQWAACLDAIAEQAVDAVIEVGAGDALTRMWSARFPSIPVRALEAFQGPEGLARWVAERAG